MYILTYVKHGRQHQVNGFTHKLWALAWWRDRVKGKHAITSAKVIFQAIGPVSVAQVII